MSYFSFFSPQLPVKAKGESLRMFFPLNPKEEILDVLASFPIILVLSGGMDTGMTGISRLDIRCGWEAADILSLLPYRHSVDIDKKSLS